MKMMIQNIMQKTPSEHFASGAVFDIARQNHDQLAFIVNSNDAMSLKSYFEMHMLPFVISHKL